MKGLTVFIVITLTTICLFATNIVTTQKIIDSPIPPNDTSVISILVGNSEGKISIIVTQCDTAADSLVMIAYTSVWEDSLTTKEDSCMNIGIWNLNGKLHISKYLNIRYWVPDNDTFTGKVTLSKQ